jgi:hypothetical protein
LILVVEEGACNADGGGGGGATGGGPSVVVDSLVAGVEDFVGVALGVDVVER